MAKKKTAKKSTKQATGTKQRPAKKAQQSSTESRTPSGEQTPESGKPNGEAPPAAESASQPSTLNSQPSPNGSTLDVPKPPPRTLSVKFGGVSIGDATARVGIRIGRGALTLDQAVALFCERRLTGSISLGSSQRQLNGMEDDDHEILSTFDTKGVGVRSKAYITGLTFALEEIDVSELAKYAKRDGTLHVTNVETIPKEKGGKSEKIPLADPPHPDVEAGKGKPHGTPALEAAAKARHEGTIPIGDLNPEKLYLCVEQTRDSLLAAGVEVPVSAIDKWCDEERDAADVWAKAVVTNAAGEPAELIDLPKHVKSWIKSKEQKKDPVAWLKSRLPLAAQEQTPVAVEFLCINCGTRWPYDPSAEQRECPECQDSFDIEIVGEQGDRNVNQAGVYVDGEETLVVRPEHADWNFSLDVSVVQGADGRWRTGSVAQSGPGQATEEEFPKLKDPGHVSREQAIEAEVGRWIGRWQKVGTEQAKAAVADLQEFLKELGQQQRQERRCIKCKKEYTFSGELTEGQCPDCGERAYVFAQPVGGKA